MSNENNQKELQHLSSLVDKYIVKEQVDGELQHINLGPTHPSTHGIFQNKILMDGERVVSSQSTVGYIHRAFEKIAERRTYSQITTLTDRLNYCSAPINNIGWHMTMEKFLGIKVTKKIDYMRIIIMELARIADHLVCDSVMGVDTGALTGFTYVFQDREKIYDLYEQVCGARMTTNIGRIGGFERDFSPKFHELIKKFIKEFPARIEEFANLLERNRIFMDRTIGVGAISAERALNYGFTGPNLRAAGVDYDARVMNPYSSYEDFDFVVPIGTAGDAYDRFMVRLQEIRESYNLVKNAYENLPEGEYHVEVPDFYLPSKPEVYTSMEALIYHFKIVMGEVDIPTGEIYNSVEGGNGELGFYMVSDGGRSPYRLHFRRPCFIYYQAYSEIIKDQMLSDAIITLGSLNVIAGELDA
ncbi:NADH-quinone oxidoreductase subunit D [Apibacter muscae]|uniref:NADH-quinone oxidoreductase subunit D n=1 Tax=Apibacter muscae TaxID=2509004 RepID=A0A563DH64_9FLAO|nr:NADH-quinone oxidoreductase subunit D [Apibacter muscae]TWP29477.1 NADH-quinone oxidoreductase subunit D [Apibacter muscae]